MKIWRKREQNSSMDAVRRARSQQIDLLEQQQDRLERLDDAVDAWIASRNA